MMTGETPQERAILRIIFNTAVAASDQSAKDFNWKFPLSGSLEYPDDDEAAEALSLLVADALCHFTGGGQSHVEKNSEKPWLRFITFYTEGYYVLIGS